MIEVRKIPDTQIVGVSLFVVFYNGSCKKVYARDEKEAEEKVREAIEAEQREAQAKIDAENNQMIAKFHEETGKVNLKLASMYKKRNAGRAFK